MSDCPRCGATDAGEEYCLTCGTHLRARERTTRFRGGSPAAVLGIVVLAALGALVAIAASRGGDEKATVVATGLPARTTVRLAPVVGTIAAPVTTAPPVTTTSARTPLPTATTLTEWTLPDGYTVVLASVGSASGRATATQIAKHALAQGLPEVGIIASQDFAGLAPGYFVVFSGLYSSEADATQHLAQAKGAGFSAAYARHVTR